MITTNIMENLNYATELKETSGVVSNRYKNVYEDTVKLAIQSYEKGYISAETLEEIREILPFNSSMFRNEHLQSYANLGEGIDQALNNMKIQSMMEEDYVPTIRAM